MPRRIRPTSGRARPRVAARTAEPEQLEPEQLEPQKLEPTSTRDRILDIALDLFVDQGFDKTSLREISDRLGFSKAAIYYHFASKDDILIALHMRLHEFGRRAIERFGEAPATLQGWADLLDEVIDEIFAQRRLIMMHQRNSAAFENLHHVAAHDEMNQDIEAQFRRVLSDPATPLHDRVRMVCAAGAIMGGLVLSGDMIKDAPPDELANVMRGAIGDLLGSRPGKRRKA